MITIEPKIECHSLEEFSNGQVMRWVSQFLINPKLECINDTKDFTSFCYHYALEDDTLEGCDEAYEVLDTYYKPIKLKDAREGDVISFHETRWDLLDEDGNNLGTAEYPNMSNAVHFAKMVQTDGTKEGTIIKSKWGGFGVFEGGIEFIPQYYGNSVQVWRKK